MLGAQVRGEGQAPPPSPPRKPTISKGPRHHGEGRGTKQSFPASACELGTDLPAVTAVEGAGSGAVRNTAWHAVSGRYQSG